MALTVSNNRIGPSLERDQVAIDTTVNSGTINAGDNLYFTGNNGAAQLAAPAGLTSAILAQIAKYMGVSRDTYPIPITDGVTETVSSGQTPSASLHREGFFTFKTNAGDSLAPNTPVTIGVDPQTVTVAPNGPSASGAAASGTGGTWSVGNHVVQATLLTTLGETMAGASATVTVASGNNITTPAVTVPAYALGILWYVDGIFVDWTQTGAALTLAGPAAVTAPVRALPLYNQLAIGVVAHDQTVVGANVDSTITGATGQLVVVRILPKI